ncbi:carbohydrate kinase family protein [Anaerotruncus colihominis]|jgi:sugar/nucleoside kinase (ribokinase family)|uniref:Carbohydrate kinase PfkB domain-containing protein n=2 Tax=Oscillospiraceae TaxID=216572 RepID=A0A845SUB8_9FIRM|nr:PfkB family carbohydrate kinase [Anaerotruncus colihominis]MCR2027110.1 PfkB family carbohydrate kinase [Anaerotruncus colihominis]NBI79224.1 hypothetical protein [Anaerotruncus colihominis]NDO40669.1 hypothetical protein [Anaerotruncus colihominis]
MMEQRIEAVVIGHTTLDSVVTYDGELHLRCPGGGCLHAAAGAAYWFKNHEVGIVTKIGPNFLEENVRTIQSCPGVDCAGIRRMDKKGMELWLLYDADGYRHWVLHHDCCTREQAAPAPRDIPARYLKEARGYHIAPLPLNQVQALLKAIPRGRRIQLDPHYEWFFPKYRSDWEQVLPYVSVLMPSEDEFTKFWDIPYGQPAQQYEPYIRQLSEMGPEIVILKMGAQGALLYQRETGAITTIPSQATKIVDATGAGDAFGGGFLAGWLKTGDVTAAAQYGMRSSARTLQLRGVIAEFLQPSPLF